MSLRINLKLKTLLSLFVFLTLAAVARPEDDGWYVIDSASFEILCERDVDVSRIARRIARTGLFTSGVYGPHPTSVPSEKVAYMMDRLLKRVRKVLDMHQPMPRVRVKIFKNGEDVAREYFRMFGKEVDYEAFYSHPLNTIYTSEEDISDSLMAHEMGHAVIDHYFGMVPPPSIGEVLASYVDKHLDDDYDD